VLGHDGCRPSTGGTGSHGATDADSHPAAMVDFTKSQYAPSTANGDDPASSDARGNRGAAHLGADR